jgi:hypothetical protein
MTKNSVYVTLALVGLGVVFGVLSLLVWMSRGHPGLIRHKLGVGALLLSFAALLAGGAVGCPETHVTCYIPLSDAEVVSNRISLRDLGPNNILVIDLQQSAVVTGNILHVRGTTFSFSVTQGQAVLQSNDIDASDGAFDEDVEEFQITIDSNIPAGTYTLRFYSVPASRQESSPHAEIAEFVLQIL